MASRSHFRYYCKSLVSVFCNYEIVSFSFVISFAEMFLYGSYSFYTLFPREILASYVVKNKTKFLRFCDIQATEYDFFCHGVAVEPLFDLVLYQNLISMCGIIKLPKTNINSFIYNLMQNIFSSCGVSFVLLHKNIKQNYLYFWLASKSVLEKTKLLKIH